MVPVRVDEALPECGSRVVEMGGPCNAVSGSPGGDFVAVAGRDGKG